MSRRHEQKTCFNLWQSVTPESKESPETSVTKLFTVSKGWLHRCSRFGLKNIKITGEVASADEKTAATFLAELKKLISVQYYPQFQVSTRALGLEPR